MIRFCCQVINLTIKAFVFCNLGTQVMEGGGRMLVTAVGLNSESGMIVSFLKLICIIAILDVSHGCD